MKARYIIILSLASFIIGVVMEKNKLLESAYSDTFTVIHEENIVHYCRCIADNPESYNTLLDGADNINEQLKQDTQTFLKTHQLKYGDFDTVLRVSHNGNHNIKRYYSNRTPKVSRLSEEYNDKVVNKAQESYNKIFGEVHDKFHQ